ncbi:MAG: hypothetical protein ABI687_01530 [Flavitalea sp.]
MLKPVVRILLFIFSVLYIFQSCAPANQPQRQKANNEGWEKTGPGGGGATFIPTFSYHSSDHFLVRCDMTGSYLTKNGGASYQQINFANGASAYAYDPKDSNTIYIGSTYLNKSSDGGKTWNRMYPFAADIKNETYEGDHASFNVTYKDSSQEIGERGISYIRIDPVLPGHLYFSRESVFYYSTDAGKSWTFNDLKEKISYLYTNSSSAKNEVFIFTTGAIYTLNKLSWSFTRKEIPATVAPALCFTAGTLANSDRMIFYALRHDPSLPIKEEFGYSEVWTSADKGNSWERIMDTLIVNQRSGKKPSYSMIACAEADAGQAYLVTNRYEEKKGDHLLYWYGALKTGDAGKSWNWVWKGGGGSGKYGVKDGIDAVNLTDAWSKKAFGGEYIRLMDVGVDPRDGQVAIVTDWYRTMKTIDGGKSWNQIYSIVQPDSSFTSNGMDVTTAYGVHFDPFDSSHIAISYTDIGYHQSFNGGKSWTRSANGVPVEWINTCYWVVFDPEVKNKVWSVWSGLHDFPRGKMTRNPKWKEYGKGGVCLSLDGGLNWTPVNEGMGLNSPATSIVLDKRSPVNNRTLYTTVYNKGVFKSTDDGKTWTPKNKGIEENTCAFEITLAPNGNLFLTISATPAHKDGKKGRDYYPGQVYKSTDGAESWTKLKVSDRMIFPNSIEVDPFNPDRLYLACWSAIDLADLVGGDVTRATGGNERLDMQGGIFLSENGGQSWKSIFDDKQYVYAVTADPYHPGRLYCNTFNQAAYRSDDSGKTWEKIKGYDFHWGQRVIIDQNDHERIYLTTFGSSVWHSLR